MSEVCLTLGIRFADTLPTAGMIPSSALDQADSCSMTVSEISKFAVTR